MWASPSPMLERLSRSLSFRLFAIFLVLAGLCIWGALSALRWVYNSDDSTFVATRVTSGDTLVWQTESAQPGVEFLFVHDLFVDSYGNMFASMVEQGTGYSNVIATYVDYSGQHQWTETDSSSDFNGNGSGRRNKSVLTSTYRLVTVVTDNRFNNDKADAFVFVTSIAPTPP